MIPMPKGRAVLAAAALAGALAPGLAAAQSQCEVYTVARGDTLSEIARAAGVPGGYQLVFDANRDVLRSPNVIEVGARLRIPCADGSLPGAAATGTPVPEAPPVTTAAAEPAALPPIRFLTAGAYAPFTDEALPEQGLFTELVKTALRHGDADLGSRVIFVNDWGAHLTELLPSGAFDMGFPWYLPDCTRIANLSPANAMRCTDYNASEPFFEAVVSFYARKDTPFAQVTSYPQLLGARLCRPDGWFTFDLEAERLVEPSVSMLVPPAQLDCWRALMEGEVDVVTFDALPAESDIDTLKLRDQVVELAPLSTLATLHVFTPKANPNGEAYLAVLNKGIAEMRASGEWFQIVSRHLSAHAARRDGT
jgi:polar amino acid transport system substrate-binding protein